MICPKCNEMSLFRILCGGKVKCKKCGEISSINELKKEVTQHGKDSHRSEV